MADFRQIPDKKLDRQCPKMDPPAYRSVPPSDVGDMESISGTLTTIDEDDEADMDTRSSFENFMTRTRRDSAVDSV